MWCGGGTCTKMPGENKERDHTGMLQLKAGGRLETPSNYRGSSHAKEKFRRRNAQRTPKNITGRVVSSKYTMPGLSFAAALRKKAEQQQQHHPHRMPVAGPAAVEQPSVSTPVRQQRASHSVPSPDVNSLPLDNMFRVASVVQQIMREFNGSVSKEAKIVAITKTVLNLMK
jgi:hypothetical protein